MPFSNKHCSNLIELVYLGGDGSDATEKRQRQQRTALAAALAAAMLNSNRWLVDLNVCVRRPSGAAGRRASSISHTLPGLYFLIRVKEIVQDPLLFINNSNNNNNASSHHHTNEYNRHDSSDMGSQGHNNSINSNIRARRCFSTTLCSTATARTSSS